MLKGAQIFLAIFGEKQCRRMKISPLQNKTEKLTIIWWRFFVTVPWVRRRLACFDLELILPHFLAVMEMSWGGINQKDPSQFCLPSFLVDKWLNLGPQLMIQQLFFQECKQRRQERVLPLLPLVLCPNHRNSSWRTVWAPSSATRIPDKENIIMSSQGLRGAWHASETYRGRNPKVCTIPVLSKFGRQWMTTEWPELKSSHLTPLLPEWAPPKDARLDRSSWTWSCCWL